MTVTQPLPEPLEICGHDGNGNPEVTTITFEAGPDDTVCLTIAVDGNTMDGETLDTLEEARQSAQEWRKQIEREYRTAERVRRKEGLAAAKMALMSTAAELSDDAARALVALAELVGRGRANAAYESLRWLRQH
jgi:hypothetical protein